MRPNGEEMLRGIQAALMTYVLPELQSAFARSELLITVALLGIVAGEYDSAAQRLADGNAALRELARRGADTLGDAAETRGLSDELRTLAAGSDGSLRLSELSAGNDRLRAAIARLAVRLQGSDAGPLRDLRAGVIDELRAEAESRSRALMGPRADG
jgi:hypothetical protein